MLAVKAEMSMALYAGDPGALAGDSIITGAEMLCKDPSFQAAIDNSGKSFEDLRKTKSLSFAREILPMLSDKATQRLNTQPENKKVAEKSKPKKDEIKFNK